MPLVSRPPLAAFAGAFAGLGLTFAVWQMSDLPRRWFADPPWESSASAVPVRPLPSDRGAILPDSTRAELFPQCSRTSPIVSGYWSPTPADIRRLEEDLSRYLFVKLSHDVRNGPPPPGSLPGYYRQYAGIVVGRGQRLIYVNAFAPRMLDWLAEAQKDTGRWRYAPMLVCDGGWILWGVEYDPVGRRFRGFSFNGEA